MVLLSGRIQKMDNVIVDIVKALLALGILIAKCVKAFMEAYEYYCSTASCPAV